MYHVTDCENQYRRAKLQIQGDNLTEIRFKIYTILTVS